MRYYLFLFAFISIFSLEAQPAIALEEFATGISSPVDITHAGDARLFVVQQGGVIRIIQDGDVLATPFLNIDGRVGSGGERGLLGLAFHPDYSNNGYFFVYYTNNGGDTQVSRFSVSDDDPNVADPNSELMILSADQPYSNHNGGCVKFGPDGYLYIGLGDGGSGGDPDGNGQNRLTFLGKILRIDVNNSTVSEPYAIPETNPFANDDFTLDEIWAVGMRNPWRYSFDRQTGDLWIGDVGQGSWEEIDFQPASSSGGENYGWRCYEGNHVYLGSGCGDIEEYDFPVYEYVNSFAGGCSVTGGYMHRGTAFTALNGYYLFSDYCAGIITSLYPDGNGGWESAELLETESFVSSFGEDVDGELYFADLFAGKIFKIVDGCSATAVTANTENENCVGEANGAITLNMPTGATVLWSTGSTENPLTGLGAGDYSATITIATDCQKEISVEVLSDHPALESPIINNQNNDLSVPEDFASYQWYVGGDAISGADSNILIAEEDGTYFVIVTDVNGCTAFSEFLAVQVVNTLEALNISYLEVNPIPFNNDFQLNLKPSTPGDYTFTIIAVNGEQIMSFKEHISSLFTDKIDMKDIPSGMYFLVIEREGLRYTKQLLKQ